MCSFRLRSFRGHEPGPGVGSRKSSSKKTEMRRAPVPSAEHLLPSKPGPFPNGGCSLVSGRSALPRSSRLAESFGFCSNSDGAFEVPRITCDPRGQSRYAATNHFSQGSRVLGVELAPPTQSLVHGAGPAAPCSRPSGQHLRLMSSSSSLSPTLRSVCRHQTC